MGDLHLAGNIKTDNIPWPNSKVNIVELDLAGNIISNASESDSNENDLGIVKLSGGIETDNVSLLNYKEDELVVVNLSDDNETDNIPWSKSTELIVSPSDCNLTPYSSEDEDIDSESTVSVTDVQDLAEKHPVDTNIAQLNLNSCSGVHVGNQAYYHGDVTIQQYVVNAKDGVKALPNSDIKGNITFLEGVPVFVSDKDGNKNIKSVLASVKFRHVWYAILVLLFVIGLTVTLLVLYLPTTPEDGYDSAISDNTTLMLFTREEWQAEEPRGVIEPLKENPAPYVIIAHTAGSNCSNFAQCARRVKDTQYDHMGRGWPDLGMNFLVGGDGAAYTGLGWGKKGMHTIPFNRRSIAIYFIGNFMFKLPPRRQINAALLLIQEGVKLGKITPDYKLFAHKQVMATESPGAALIPEIMKWPHWTTYEKSDELVL